MTTSGKSFLENLDKYKFKRYTAKSKVPKTKHKDGYYCKFCGKKVPKRKSLKWFCDWKCSLELGIRSGFKVRARVLFRDKGKCQICFQPGSEVDHIIPVVEGGGSCGLENLRLLCSICHKTETKKLRVRLKKKEA